MSNCGESLSNGFPMRMLSYEQSVAIRQYICREIGMFGYQWPKSGKVYTVKALAEHVIGAIVPDSKTGPPHKRLAQQNVIHQTGATVKRTARACS